MIFFSKLKAKLQRLNRTADSYQEKITFSQANAYNPSDHEDSVMCLENENQNLVVACYESRFSDEMIDYALEMANRMDYGIIAVNAANLSHDVTEFFSTNHETLFQDFKETAQKNVRSFQEKAVEQGIQFTHAIKFSGVDKAIEEITKECGQIEFIISENQESKRSENSIGNEQRIAQRLFVYSVN